MSEIECPYCCEDTEPPGDCYNEDEVYTTECDHCEKNFTFTISYSTSYHADKADCLNGGEHDWQRICGTPDFAYAGKRKCSMCDETRRFEIEPDEWAACEKEAAKYEYARKPLEELRRKYHPDFQQRQNKQEDQNE